MSEQHGEPITSDFDEEGRPVARQEDEIAGTGAPGVDVGKPDAFPAEESEDLEEHEEHEDR